jgi:deoxyribonuclease-4
VQIGAHVSSSGGIDKAIDRAVEIGADSVQVFTQSPRAWRPTNHDPASFERFREKREEAGIGGVLCHAIYLVNLAAPDPLVYERSVATLRNTTEVASAIGADVVFHVGSHLGSGFEVGLERVVPALEQVLELTTDETWVLMENSAGAGGTIGRSIEELATIYDRMGHPHLGICLDSCHLWVGRRRDRPGRARGLPGRARLSGRPRQAAGAARERRSRAVRIEPRPAREHP